MPAAHAQLVFNFLPRLLYNFLFPTFVPMDSTMLELNAVTSQIKDMRARLADLRRYL